MRQRLRLLWLYPWWWAWGFGRWLRHAEDHRFAVWYWDSGRCTSWRPVRCSACGWRGPQRWAVHTHKGCLDLDVQPIDYCPAKGCGKEIW